MSSFENIVIDYPADHVFRIRVNRPRKLNAIDFSVREEIYTALKENCYKPAVRVLVFGGVDGNLSAGGDLPSMKNLSPEQAHDRLAHIHLLVREVLKLNIPIVTCVNGVAAGAAVGLALLGEYIIGEKESRVLVPFLKLGLVPDWGMTLTLPARVGLPAARRIMIESQTLDADTASEIGFFDELVEKGEGETRAVERAVKLSRLPKAALGRLKRSLQIPGLVDYLDQELVDQVDCLTGPEFAEGFESYVDKRRPNFTDIS